HCRFIIFCHGYNDITFMGDVLFSDNHPVTIMDTRFDHAVTGYVQQENLAVVVCSEMLWKREVLIYIFDSCNRQTGRNLAEYRHLDDGSILPVLLHDDFYRTGFGRIAFDISLILQFGKMSVYSRTRLQADSIADFPNSWRISFILNGPLDVLIDLLLPVR